VIEGLELPGGHDVRTARDLLIAGASLRLLLILDLLRGERLHAADLLLDLAELGAVLLIGNGRERGEIQLRPTERDCRGWGDRS